MTAEASRGRVGVRRVLALGERVVLADYLESILLEQTAVAVAG